MRSTLGAADRRSNGQWRSVPGCGEAFRQTRDDARFCSSKCRQSAYRRRLATGEKVGSLSHYDPNDAIHLDEIAGVLHYQGTPIIAINQMIRWRGFGNRHVGPFPTDDKARAAMRSAGYFVGMGDHLFECAECRRWSVSRAFVFCSRKCRLAHRAEQARERRVAWR
jgi:ribosomal protein L24E